jgi:uncharacterized membrane protein YkvA (DUF1232 family)
VTLPLKDRLRSWAKSITRDVHALWLAARDPRVPWYAKALAGAVAAYALSPIDLIPDFIPVLGYLDDLLIVPLGILLVIKLVPPDIMVEHRAAALAAQDTPRSANAAVVIVAIWATLCALFVWLAYRPRATRSGRPTPACHACDPPQRTPPTPAQAGRPSGTWRRCAPSRSPQDR